MNGLIDILVIFFTSVALPVSIVLITAISKIKRDKQRAQVLIKAIEANNNIDADKLAEALKKPVKSPREMLIRRLLRGCIFTLIGFFLIAIEICDYAITSSDMADDSVSALLIFGAISLAIGISYLIVYFVTRKQVNA